MKSRIAIAVCVVIALAATPFVTTKITEWRLRDPNRIVLEIGYSIPEHAHIIETTASIWSLADGANYSWTISSPKSLLPWVQSLSHLEYGKTYKAVKFMPDGRSETSYITISANTLQARVETFRP